jgi:hypothetical protein
VLALGGGGRGPVLGRPAESAGGEKGAAPTGAEATQNIDVTSVSRQLLDVSRWGTGLENFHSACVRGWRICGVGRMLCWCCGTANCCEVPTSGEVGTATRVRAAGRRSHGSRVRGDGGVLVLTAGA